MEVTSTKAALVAEGDVDSGSRLTVTLPRYEVEAALKEAEQPELVLDVLRATGEAKDAERHSISVAWEPSDIEKLLSETPGDAITFAFDRGELEQLIDHDTEAHGLREKALVLTVAVGIAASGATSSMAGVDNPAGPQAGSAPVATFSSHDEMTSAQRGIETPVAPQRDEATLAQRGIEPTVVSQPDEATLAQRGIPDTVVATHDEATAAARGIPTPAATPVAASADDGITLDPSTAAALGLAGGMGLLIAGAAFVARRQRAPHPA